jgi:hypothetical protein
VGSRKNKKGGKQEYLKKKHVKTHKTQGSLWRNIQAVTVQHMSIIMLSSPAMKQYNTAY